MNFSTCDCHQNFKEPGLHVPTCPMITTCLSCGKKPWFCRMMRTCIGISKPQKYEPAKVQQLIQKRNLMENEIMRYTQMLRVLHRINRFSKHVQDHMLELKNKYEALKIELLNPSPVNIQCFEVLLFKIRRIYITQKQQHDRIQAAKQAFQQDIQTAKVAHALEN
jgi:hypothetical protein